MTWLYLILCSPNFQVCPIKEPTAYETMEERKAAEEKAKDEFLKLAEKPDAPLFIALSYCVDRERAYKLGLPLPEGRGI